MDVKKLLDIPSWEWPQDTDKTFLKMLRDRRADASDRLIAAELAGDIAVIDDTLADALLSVVKNADETDQLRITAVLALGPVLEYTYDEIEMPDERTISAGMFNGIQGSLQRLYADENTPGEVRRRILEASVRAPQDWHHDAIYAAYAGDNEDWKVTAVFCMGFIDGFDEEILESLNSRNPDIYYEAVCAAGDWGLDGAWRHIKSILSENEADKPLLLAAIEAAVNIRPQEASGLLADLIYSDDEDISEAVHEAMSMIEIILDNDSEEEDEDDEPIQ